MNWDKIALISETYGKDEYGIDVITEASNEVYARVDSISGREFFNAGQSDIKPEFKMTINADEYGGEKIIDYSGQRYSVYRTYRVLENSLELYVERKAGTSGEYSA